MPVFNLASEVELKSTAVTTPVTVTLPVIELTSVVIVTLELPSNDTEPVASPTSVIVLAVVRELADPVILETSITPVEPENISDVLVPSGIKVKNPVESSKPKKPTFGVVPTLYLNSTPLSLLSSVAGGVVPPRVIIGSSNCTVVELTVVVVPDTVRLPAIVMFPDAETFYRDKVVVEGLYARAGEAVSIFRFLSPIPSTNVKYLVAFDASATIADVSAY